MFSLSPTDILVLVGSSILMSLYIAIEVLSSIKNPKLSDEERRNRIFRVGIIEALAMGLLVAFILIF